MIEHSSEVAKLFAAIHAAQGVMTGVAKDSVNPHFKNRYASLENVIEAAKPALQANGLAFTQAPGALVDNAIEVTTMLMHVSGEWLRSTLHVPLVKRDPQGVGSAITYGTRYALMATLGLPPVDDDAETATDRAPRREPSVERPAPRQEAPNAAVQALIDDARVEATRGVIALERFWNRLATSQKVVLQPYMPSIKSAAERIDEIAHKAA
jgi:hypothetical protein